MHYEIGQQVKNTDGQLMTITEVEEHNGCLIYLGDDEDGQILVLPELDLDSFVQFSNPQERLFAGQIDKISSYQLRLETLKHYRNQQKSPVTGLLGARIQLLPHQLYIAVQVAGRHAPRVLLADEVGLGKTIEAGLIIHQQLMTGQASRVLIAVPDSLVHQWLVEMLRRFNLLFTILDEERCLALVESGTENPFESAQLVLCSTTFLSERADRLQQAVASNWDLLVVDEAHHLEWTEQFSSPVYQAIESLAEKTRGILLLTATPEQQGIDGHFARLRLLDPARYSDLEAFRKEEERYASVNALVQTLLSEDGLQSIATGNMQQSLGKFLGKTALAAFNNECEKGDSEPHELLQRLITEILDRHGTGRVLFRNTRASIEGFPERSLHAHLLPAPETFGAIAGDTDSDTVNVYGLLRTYLLLWEAWPELDTRVSWLVEFLQQQRGNKILIICSLADTALELEQYLSQKHGVHSAVFHEGLSLVARDRAAAYFAEEEQGAQVLVCSEIGSEGRNFQFSNHLVMFDLPLNPDLLEQRIGRLDRIGQNQDVCIHIPCYQQSAQHVLLRWYHEGVNAIEQTCAIGQTMYRHFEQALGDCMLNPLNESAIDDLLSQTRDKAESLLSNLRQGRDRLLELNSCDTHQADQIVESMLEREQHLTLANYMERVFDQFGVDQEHHSAGSIVLHPGEHMIAESFPGLPQDGLTATYQRNIALSREEFHYLTWEHPMVAGAMDMVLSGDFGNTTFCTLRLPPLKPGTILLEAFFTVSCPAPAALQLHRYLPMTTIRVVVDSKNNDLSNILTEKHFNKLGKKTRRHTAQDFVRQTRSQLVSMIKQAEKLAAKNEVAIIEKASDRMTTVQQSEIKRMQALAKVNPNIRQEEIDHLMAETDELQDHLNTAGIKLEALRVAVVTDSA